MNKSDIVKKLIDFIISLSEDEIKSELDKNVLTKKIDKIVSEYCDKVDSCMEQSIESDKIKEYQLGVIDILVGDLTYNEDEIIKDFKEKNPSIFVDKKVKDLVYSGIYNLYSTFNDYFTIGERAVYKRLGDVDRKIDALLSSDADKKADNVKGRSENSVKFNDSKQEYSDKWHSRMFLSTDENPITLADAFVWPDYKYKDKIYSNLEEELNAFIEQDGSDVIFLLGVPGMGKSSIVSCLSNKYANDNNVIVLKFKDLLSDSITRSPSLLSSICEVLNCKKRDLSYKTLIIDGFDEIRIMSDSQLILKDFLLDILDIKQFKLITTSRINYIDCDYFEIYNIYTLQEFNESKIRQFYNTICHKIMPDNTIIDNEEVWGIPVILYMALSVGIGLSQQMSKCEIYERIFSLKGGVFDRFTYGSVKGYGLANHGIAYVKEQFRLILKRVAFEMFNNNVDYISNSDYISIVKEYIKETENERVIFEFPIKNLYEVGMNIEFVHKSIYEFFAAEYIFAEINESIGNSCECVAGVLGDILCHGILTEEIIAYLKYKVDNGAIKSESNKILDVFNIMLEDGMLYHTQKCYKNGLECELVVFSNMLRVLHLWKFDGWINVNKKIHIFILPSTKGNDILYLLSLDLSGINMENMDLRNANLRRADLRNANLRNADLRGADLIGANLRGADLRGTVMDE